MSLARSAAAESTSLSPPSTEFTPPPGGVVHASGGLPPQIRYIRLDLLCRRVAVHGQQPFSLLHRLPGPSAELPLPPARPAPHFRGCKRPRPPDVLPGAQLPMDPSPRTSAPSQYAPADRLLRGPFVGDYKGSTWNSQGFFATKAMQHWRKRRYLSQLIARSDFVLLSETHGTVGSQAAFTDLPGTKSFWSAGSAARAGVGIVVQESFLARFDSTTPHLVELLPGRLAKLPLRGIDGALDIIVAYFPTGTRRMLDGLPSSSPPEPEVSLRRQREDLSRLLRRQLSTQKVLTIVAGDFNFVHATEDRMNKDTGKFTGYTDDGEAEQWSRVFLGDSGMYELWQPDATHDGPHSRARLDRVYVTQPLCDQLDRATFAAPLAWCPDLSQHRPLAFGRISRQTNMRTDAPLSESVVRSPAWTLRVSADFHARLRSDSAASTSPLRRLSALKQSMRVVSDRMRLEQQAASPPVRPAASDELGVVMAALRRLERHRWLWLPRFAQRSPLLRGALTQDLIDTDPGAAAALLRPLAVTLAKQGLRAEMEQLQADLPDLNDQEAQRRRCCILRKVRRLAPGRAAGALALEDADGAVQTDPSAVAAILRLHWGDVFAKRCLREADIRRWLQHDLHAPDGLAAALHPLLADPTCWRIRREDIVNAIDRTSKSAPGPDGIPYAAWRALGPLAHDTLFAAAQALEASDGLDHLAAACPLDEVGQSAFNAAVMVFLQKKEPLISAAGVAYTKASDLRPLSIVNTDNRLLANALRLRIEPLLSQVISTMQQGFLPGRSLLKNVIDVDAAMREVAFEQDDPAAVFFDFQAAFPSISHAFLHETLSALGLPPTVCRFISCLYWGHGCRIAGTDGLHEGFRIGAGIRQGCPISPLLFAVVVDPLLRRLRRALPSDTVRAYADDLAVVLRSLSGALPCLVEIFQDFAAASGLHLNFGKVILIPLGDATPASVSLLLQARFPAWSLVQCRLWAKYLGFVLGPERGERAWEQALAKALARARLWAQVALGLQFAALVYKVYVSSILGFLLQLERLPSSWQTVEASLFRALVPGPFRWCAAADLHGLRQDFSFPQEFVDLREVSLAARFRVTQLEAAPSGRTWRAFLAPPPCCGRT